MPDEQHAPAIDWRPLYPFSTRHLTLPDGTLHLVDHGAGDPVLMVHGNPTWSFYFHPLIHQLETGFRCIAVDHLGCGWSDKPPARRFTLNDRIDHLHQLVEALDLRRVTLVAHDWGGAIGLGAMLRCRDRFERIVLFNTGAFPPPYIPWRIRACRLPILGRWAVQGANLFARAAIRMATARVGGLEPQVAAGLLAPYDRWDHRAAIHQFVADIPTRRNQPTWQTLDHIERQLASVRNLPRLLVWGMRDWCFRPVCLDRLLQHWPDATVVRVEQAGHYVLLDAPEIACRAIADFLKNPLGGRAQ